MQEVVLHRDVSLALRSTLRDCENGMPEELVVNSLALNNVPVEITRGVIALLLNAEWIARRDGRLYYVSYDETKDQKL
jgi:hypothetical protein